LTFVDTSALLAVLDASAERHTAADQTPRHRQTAAVDRAAFASRLIRSDDRRGVAVKEFHGRENQVLEREKSVHAHENAVPGEENNVLGEENLVPAFSTPFSTKSARFTTRRTSFPALRTKFPALRKIF
jgi:hypothetical protein